MTTMTLTPFELLKTNSLTLPSSGEDDWRYLNWEPLLETCLNTAVQSAALPEVPSNIVVTTKQRVGADPSSVVSANSPETSSFFEQLSCVCSENETLIQIPAGQSVTKPLLIQNKIEANGASAFPRYRLSLQKGAKATAIIAEDIKGIGSFLCQSIVIDLAEDASLEVVVLRQGTETSLSADTWQIELKKNASFKVSVLVSGLALSDQNFNVKLLGEGANAALEGLALLSGRQQSANRIYISHACEAGQSRQLFKQILMDEAVNDFRGLVHVLPKAQKTNSYQLSRNLLLSDKARAISRPQLRIFADDVKCSHGSTSGELPAQEILYLCSRGLSRQDAEKILIDGFAREVSDAIAFADGKNAFEAMLQQHLPAALEKKR